jgi:DcuC family C4-dicarboxylate transporter
MPSLPVLLLGVAIIAAAIVAILRQVDVRLALLLAALALGAIVGKPQGVVQKFFTTLTAQEFVIPICCSMGFAYVLRQTLCDQHLIHLLTDPLRRAKLLLIPGAVLVGFLVNIPIVSQASTVAAIGAVLIPLLLNARVSRVTAGAAMLLGASIGGELLNPGAVEFRTVVRESGKLGYPVTGVQCARAALVLVLLHLAVAVAVFWRISARAEADLDRQRESREALDPELPVPPQFHVNLLKAAIPLLPVVLLFLAVKPLALLPLPHGWLVGPEEPDALFDSRLIGAAMLVGVVAAALADHRAAPRVMVSFFEGAGYALTHIISVIVAAACFGEGVKGLGFDALVRGIVGGTPALLVPTAGLFPMAFAWVSGSGMAATQSLYEFFVRPAVALGVAPEHVGAVVALAAAAGRTMSPVAAVTLMCASMTETRPLELVKRVAPPLLAGVLALLLLGTALATTRKPGPLTPPVATPSVQAPANAPAR